eukprot:gene2505-4867_t
MGDTLVADKDEGGEAISVLKYEEGDVYDDDDGISSSDYCIECPKVENIDNDEDVVDDDGDGNKFNDAFKRKTPVYQYKSKFKSNIKSKPAMTTTQATKIRHEYEPCSHEGACSSTNTDCLCGQRGGPCEKFCVCDRSCKRRFPGCRCKSGRCCGNQCKCFIAGRECDPDLCSTCGVCIHPYFVPAVSEHLSNTNTSFPMCLNSALSWSLSSRVAAGRSSIHGWGLYAQEPLDKNEFIMEYTGEIVSQIDLSFLFGLNEDNVLDATRKGGLSKFVNHSEDPNCVTKVVLVNGDHRIKILALKAISAGEELTFNYNHDSNEEATKAVTTCDPKQVLPTWMKKKKPNNFKRFA